MSDTIKTIETADAIDLGEALLEQDRRLALELDRWLSAQLRDQIQSSS